VVPPRLFFSGLLCHDLVPEQQPEQGAIDADPENFQIKQRHVDLPLPLVTEQEVKAVEVGAREPRGRSIVLERREKQNEREVGDDKEYGARPAGSEAFPRGLVTEQQPCEQDVQRYPDQLQE